MDPQARAAFPDLLLEFGEGATDWMYLDQAPQHNVTIGRGNMLPTLDAALALDWGDATPAEVRAAWLKVVSHPDLAHKGGGAFAPLTTVRATKASLDGLIQARLDQFDAELRLTWPGWDEAPGAAQEALMRLAWACGPALAPRWPRLHQLWTARDWAGCAEECAIPALDATEPGANERERQLFLSCAVADTEPVPAI